MNKIRTLYIAGPMTGLPENNYPEFFDVQSRLEGHGYQVLNPARVDILFPKNCGHTRLDAGCDPCVERDWSWYMRKTIAMMMEADAIALLRNWERSQGAQLETQIATRLNMAFHPWQTWALKAVEAKGELAKKKRVQKTLPSVHLVDPLDVTLPFCRTKGKPRAPMSPTMSEVTCQRCKKKKEG